MATAPRRASETDAAAGPEASTGRGHTADSLDQTEHLSALETALARRQALMAGVFNASYDGLAVLFAGYSWVLVPQ